MHAARVRERLCRLREESPPRAMPQAFVWLASLGHLRTSGRRIYVPDEAESNFTRSALDGCVSAHSHVTAPNMIYGLARIEYAHPYDLMHVNTPAEREQCKFWKNIVGGDALAGRLFFWKVLAATFLDTAMPIMQCVNRRLRGFVVPLEPGQAPRLVSGLPGGAQQWCATDAGPPGLAFRLPPQFAMCVCGGQWRSIVLPHVPRDWSAEGRGGSATLVVDWRALGMVEPMPVAPPIEVADDDAQLDCDIALQVADSLRLHAQGVDRGSAEGQEEYLQLYRLVHVVEAVYQQMDPFFIASMCKDLRSKSSLLAQPSGGHQRLRYNVVFLVRALLMADLLRNASALGDAILHGLRLLVPPVLARGLAAAIKSPKEFAPHAGTISRWRLLLDGAYMLHMRRKNHDGQQKQFRYLMADSSVQHGRDFEVVFTMTIREDAAVRALHASNALAECWSCLSSTPCSPPPPPLGVGWPATLAKGRSRSRAYTLWINSRISYRLAFPTTFFHLVTQDKA